MEARDYAITVAPAPSGLTVFQYTGGVQTYTVPCGVTSLTVDMAGAMGGRDRFMSTSAYSGNGYGGRVR